MTRTRRPSPQTVAVLRALAADPSAWRYGYELGRQVGLKAGSLYPILIRLADREMLETSWEPDPPQGRPPRHLYRLTGAGRLLAAEVTPEPDGIGAQGEPRSAW
ncbi:helix-turn-helix transcriptional regulator [Streptosporangium sp. NPDC051023]|uniref:PadR family transcriptional regulator n=1 Tax=Streptosporangium sp. NPDC051023 TaxID=3155410 RepID=UPI00344B4FCB